MPVPCKNCPIGVKKSYKGSEPSPNGLGYSASYDPVNTRRQGLDGKSWKVVQKGHAKVWKVVGTARRTLRTTTRKAQKGSLYDIHDNGGTPFTVKVSKTKVEVFASENDSDSDDTNGRPNTVLVLTLKSPEKVFIGKDGANGRKFDGNSILVREARDSYVYIGSEVYRFRTKDGIERYVSPVGNSDVPYPYAVGRDYTYLMIENVMIPNGVLAPGDPYPQFYGLSKKASAQQGVKPLVSKKVLLKRRY